MAIIVRRWHLRSPRCVPPARLPFAILSTSGHLSLTSSNSPQLLVLALKNTPDMVACDLDRVPASLAALDARQALVLTIDGPTASGKGTIAQRVAQSLGFHYLDSGALYRVAALAATRAGVSLDDAAALADIGASLPVRFEPDGRVLLAGDDVSEAIRTEPAGQAASRVAVHPPLREALLALQRGFQHAPGLVADGRDMGTVVFPQAALKVFLTATPESRADRRYKQLIEKGISANLVALLQDLQQRDARDQSRAVAPLKPAQGAYVLDSTGLDVDQTVEQVLNRWAARR